MVKQKKEVGMSNAVGQKNCIFSSLKSKNSSVKNVWKETRTLEKVLGLGSIAIIALCFALFYFVGHVPLWEAVVVPSLPMSCIELAIFNGARRPR